MEKKKTGKNKGKRKNTQKGGGGKGGEGRTEVERRWEKRKSKGGGRWVGEGVRGRDRGRGGDRQTRDTGFEYEPPENVFTSVQGHLRGCCEIHWNGTARPRLPRWDTDKRGPVQEHVMMVVV